MTILSLELHNRFHQG